MRAKETCGSNSAFEVPITPGRKRINLAMASGMLFASCALALRRTASAKTIDAAGRTYGYRSVIGRPCEGVWLSTKAVKFIKWPFHEAKNREYKPRARQVQRTRANSVIPWYDPFHGQKLRPVETHFFGSLNECPIQIGEPSLARVVFDSTCINLPIDHPGNTVNGTKAPVGLFARLVRATSSRLHSIIAARRAFRQHKGSVIAIVIHQSSRYIHAR